ncbi:Leucine-rich_repeat domain superfamily [Hexamita inflata]|uniref:Leucine-rich repeat domain superfamily n=1 Tax=Hexamita inflata TaxID=28002 RepID=A0AA86QUD6_9EUKA|nr:Leucine-rich repeat domain superfamily [Hexamita inflata]
MTELNASNGRLSKLEYGTYNTYKSLIVSNNRLSDFEFLKYYKQLEIFSACGCQISGFKKLVFQNYDLVTNICLCDNNIRSFDFLHSMSQLQQLDLSGNPLSSQALRSYVQQFPKLQCMSFSFTLLNSAQFFFQSLSNCYQLQEGAELGDLVIKQAVQQSSNSLSFTFKLQKSKNCKHLVNSNFQISIFGLQLGKFARLFSKSGLISDLKVFSAQVQIESFSHFAVVSVLNNKASVMFYNTQQTCAYTHALNELEDKLDHEEFIKMYEPVIEDNVIVNYQPIIQTSPQKKTKFKFDSTEFTFGKQINVIPETNANYFSSVQTRAQIIYQLLQQLEIQYQQFKNASLLFDTAMNEISKTKPIIANNCLQLPVRLPNQFKTTLYIDLIAVQNLKLSYVDAYYFAQIDKEHVLATGPVTGINTQDECKIVCDGNKAFCVLNSKLSTKFMPIYSFYINNVLVRKGQQSFYQFKQASAMISVKVQFEGNNQVILTSESQTLNIDIPLQQNNNVQQIPQEKQNQNLTSQPVEVQPVQNPNPVEENTVNVQQVITEPDIAEPVQSLQKNNSQEQEPQKQGSTTQ